MDVFQGILQNFSERLWCLPLKIVGERSKAVIDNMMERIHVKHHTNNIYYMNITQLEKYNYI